MTNSWSKWKLIRFSLLTIIIILALIEIIFRVLFYFDYKGYNTSLYIQGNSLQMSDSILVFRNRPFYVDYTRRFQYNEDGMKVQPGDVFMPKKKPGEFWVFLLGGSTMEGMGSNKDGEWLDITGVDDYPANESIAAYLQSMLQEEMPSKKIRVFNAANSSYTLLQSCLRYQSLARENEIDWLVSMDGKNEPPALEDRDSPMSIVKDGWRKNPIFNFPLNAIIPLTSHSAFANKMKQLLYQYKRRKRLEENQHLGFPRKDYWYEQPDARLKFSPYTNNIKNAVKAFYEQLARFDSLLNSKKQSHILFIQPQLAFRDRSKLGNTEKALFNYYLSKFNDSTFLTFYREVQDSFPTFKKDHHNIELLNDMDSLSEQVFVDYCHFTKMANQYLARRIANEILSRQLQFQIP